MILRKKMYLADVRMTACDYAFIVSETKRFVKQRQMMLVSPIASQTIAKASRQSNLKETLSRFTYLVPDGYWVKKALEWKYGCRIQRRVYGPNLTLHILQAAEKNKHKVAFYGTTTETLHALKQAVRQRFPRLDIVVMIPSVFRPLQHKEYHSLITKLNKYKPDILFVGIGSPLQEEFTVQIASYALPRLKPMALFTVGAAFDFIAGTKKQAPEWMGECGFEWLFRLLNEPGRLWKRYLILGSDYLIQMMRDITRYKLQRLHLRTYPSTR